MRFCKRLVGVVLALILVTALLPSAFARQYYTRVLREGDTEEIEAMLDRISQQTFVNTDAETVRTYIEHFLYRSDFAAVGNGRFRYTNAKGYYAGKAIQDGTFYQVVSGAGCFAYSRFVALAIYGTEGRIRDIGQAPGHITASRMKIFIEKYAQAGEHIRIDNRHSVTYISHTEDGFYYLDYAGDEKQRISLCFSTYGNFAAKCNEVYVRVLLFDSNNAENGAVLDSALDASDSHWLSDYMAAAQQQGLIPDVEQTGIVSGMSLGETVVLAAQARSLFDSNAAGEMPFLENVKNGEMLNKDLNHLLQISGGDCFNLLFFALADDLKPVRFEQSANYLLGISKTFTLQP